MPENNYYLYIHTNRINGKKYVGITNNIKERWRNNGITYKPYGAKNTRPFWNAICKYGFDAFDHEVIKENLSFEEACELERQYISNLGTRESSKGYNVAEGGNGGRIYKEHPRGMLGRHHSKEKRDQQREILERNKKAGLMQWKNGHPRGMLGKHHTPEHNAYMSKKMKGRIISAETRKKMSEASKNRVFSLESRRKMSLSQKGKHQGEDNHFSKPVIYILDGVEYHASCRREACEKIGIGVALFDSLQRSGLPYVPRGQAKYKYAKFTGLVIRYV